MQVSRHVQITETASGVRGWSVLAKPRFERLAGVLRKAKSMQHCPYLSVKAIALLICLVLSANSSVFAIDGPLEGLEEQAFKQAAALADPSIVRIETVGGLAQVDDVLLATGPTSGVVVSADGYIISSSFNFISKPTSILVTLPDGRRLAARQIANDKSRLLTLLKVDADGLVPAKPAPSDQVKVGQWALALGRTLDNSTPSMSVGIVSALNRIWGKAIQTDAKTSPVNYGGALVDIEGRTLGIIAPLSPSGSDEMAGVEWYDGGIGFAIPLDDVYASLDRMKQGTDLLPGLIGITLAGGQALNVPAVIDRVRYNSPAQQAGIKVGDRIVEVEGEKIVRVAQFKSAMGRKFAGDNLKLVVKRGEETHSIDLSLVGQLVPYETPFLGILPERNTSQPGVGVRLVFPKVNLGGLQRGDRITKFSNDEVADAKALTEAVSRGRPGDKVALTFVRDQQPQTVEVTLSTLPEEIVEELPAEVIPSSEKRDEAAKKADGKGDEKSGEPKTGRFTETLAGFDHDYWAYVPENYNPSHAYGLVVWLHPNGDLMESTIQKEWKTICDHRGLIMVAPKSEKILQWQPGEAEFVKGVINYFREKYTIDPSRVALHTLTLGAPITWLTAVKNRDLVKGVAIISAPFGGVPPENVPESRQQFYFICGDADKMTPLVKNTVAAFRKLKLPVSLTTIKGLGMKYPASEEIERIGRWIDSLDRI